MLAGIEPRKKSEVNCIHKVVNRLTVKLKDRGSKQILYMVLLKTDLAKQVTTP
jgi:hypothetical protein